METRTVSLFLLAILPLCNTAVIPDNAPVHIHIEGPLASADVDIPNSPDEMVRIKRSGSGSGSPDFFGYIKRGITGKISQFAQASAGASAHFSKGSSGGGGGGGGYYYPAPHDISYGTKSFDFWTLKKSILNTLLQAVKAINGGIIAVKGQLIKGGGAIISAKGKLISMKGEAIASVGRHIITNAKLSPSGGWSASKPEVVEYSAPSGHGGPGPTAIVHPSPSYGPPPAEYGPPSSPSGPSVSAPTAGFPDHPPSTYGAPTAPAYGPPIGPSGSAAPSQAYLPQKVTGSYDAYKSKLKLKPGADAHAGIVILKKIPKDLEPAAALASLPLQDERHKVVKPTVDVTKTPLFVPDPTPYEPQPPPPPKHGHKAHPFFESALKPIQPPESIYASPIDAPPSGSGPSGYGAPHFPVFPTPSSIHSVTSPPGFVDDSLIHNHHSDGIKQSHFDINKPLEHYENFEHPPPPPPHVDIKGVQNIFKNNNNLFLSKIPAPFEINSFGGNSNYRLSNFGLGSLNNVHSVHSALPAPVKTDFSGALDPYAPPFSNLGTDFSSHLQYKDGILEHKGAPHFDIVKSVQYELPIQKRHEKRTEIRH